MSALPRTLALLAGLSAWGVATFWADLGLAHPGRRWMLFVSGTVFLLLFATARKGARDPGPFERGFGFSEGTPMPSFGAVAGLTVVALALRLITLGRPAFVDATTLGTLWPFATGSGSVVSRLPFALCGALSPALLYFATRRSLGERSAILAGAVLAVAPAHVVLSQSLAAGALTLFLFLASTLALQNAIATDRAALWWLYTLTTLAAVLLGPWSLAILCGHAVILIGWGLGRAVTGYPAPVMRNFLSVLAIVATVQAFGVAVIAARPAAEIVPVSWGWLATGVDRGAVPIAVWIVAALGLPRLAGKRKTLSVLLVLAPAVLAPMVQWLIRPDRPFAVVPWPVLPGLAVAVGLGLGAILDAIRFLARSAFPGRIPEHAWRPIAVLIAGALIAASITPGLRRHYNRAAAAPPTTGQSPVPPANASR